MSVLHNFRSLHKQFASVLFVFFFLIGLTGCLLSFKSAFTKVIFENKLISAESKLARILPLDSLEKIATAVLNEKANTNFKKSEKLEIKISKGTVLFYYKDAYSIQINGASGAPILIEKKFGGVIQDIHDGAILDGLFANKLSLSKKVYSIIMGLSLLLLTITGTYMWYKPKMLKNKR
ncbi:MAG: PepSY-associated TM helix domain-containing protein [Chitinophagia bacterium]|jgi:uncharacterized iron-regulated membrane protein